MRLLLASALCGLILAVAAPLVVHLALPGDMQRELVRALCEARHRRAPDGDGLGAFSAHELAVAVGIRFCCGLLAMLLVAWLRRRRSPWRAARIAAFWLWLLGYLAWPLFLYIGYALDWRVLLLAIGYGFAEMNLACHAGTAVLVGRSAERRRR